jgi:hypothetical protein
MSSPSNVDRLVTAIRELVQAVINQGQIAGGETVMAAQTALRDALSALVEGAPNPTETGS